MTLPNLTQSEIQEHTSGGSFERGQEYLAEGAVLSLERPNKETLKAQVQGSDVHPYIVTVQFDDEAIRKVQCTCPYFEGSWCKHIVATLLKALKQEEIPVAESRQVHDLVRDLNRDDLVTLLDRLVEKDPRLLDEIRDERAQLSTEQ
jgi:uncharacterized Zn finger protein